ncbi:acetyltransferase [Colletotrichum higginsianum]|uniref:Acetyltransferase n=1 Tax=Colletotrichum higginsianum (strain IMI 349063) TaxID=759273 RepID=H1VKT4_COLHI|nr:Acetyltransferase [Colletotrichum higginsianum IMI 349063]OBR14720.1 Acetyltransferase [Colletotrichum higginsianum IMI 349063]GJD05280.1 acetyltransferase [Colletotrichum higginsianum]CCF40837.1 acetyltransferase [Colletotrichum higginsianum]
MPIEIRKALDRDLRRCAEIGHQAFANNPFFKVKFPGYVPKDGFLGLRTDDLSRQLREDPTARMFVAVDTERRGDSAIVGFAKWNVYPSGMPYAKSTPSSWGAAANVDVCKAVFGGVEEMRNRLMAGKPCIFTDPMYQQRGVGQHLMAFGIQESLRLDIPIYLESTEAGHSLYSNIGFDDVEVHRADIAKSGQSRPHLIWAMIREAYCWFP